MCCMQCGVARVMVWSMQCGGISVRVWSVQCGDDWCGVCSVVMTGEGVECAV